VGWINSKEGCMALLENQLEKLMAHGLAPEQAVDLIGGGLLGQPESAGIVTFRKRTET
jgi:hypothetical protein